MYCLAIEVFSTVADTMLPFVECVACINFSVRPLELEGYTYRSSFLQSPWIEQTSENGVPNGLTPT